MSENKLHNTTTGKISLWLVPRYAIGHRMIRIFIRLTITFRKKFEPMADGQQLEIRLGVVCVPMVLITNLRSV
jgi:hypothetical protein